MRFVLASHNKGKLAEMQAILGELGVEVVMPSDVGVDVDVEETGTTFAENAALKANAIMAASGLPAIADDDEPAADLATLLAIASSFRDLPLGRDLAAVGEVGLSGEIRSVSNLNSRLSEIARLGFKRCVIPAHVKDDIRKPDGLELISVKDIREAIKATLG